MNNLIDFDLKNIINQSPENFLHTELEIATAIFSSKNTVFAFLQGEDIFFKSLNENLITANEIKEVIKIHHNFEEKICINAYNSVISVANRNFDASDIKKYLAVTLNFPNNLQGVLYVLSSLTAINDLQLSTLKLIGDKIIETLLLMNQATVGSNLKIRKLIHDIKNPLTSISLQAEIISKLSSEKDQINLVSTKILAGINRINDYLNQQKQ